MAPRGVRGSAEERREDVLNAAMVEFAKGGLDGTSTEAIATRAGISQPYLFRLYPSKRALFIAAVERTFTEVVRVFEEAAAGLSGLEAKHAMGEAYDTLLREDRTFLGMQLQAYAACCGDDEVRAVTRRHLGRLWERVVTDGGMSEQLAQAFVAHGMLCNLTAALGVDESQAADDALARRMTAKPVVLDLMTADPISAGSPLT
ncbi:transcriptional regulator, TetR family [Jatrophihabitans endophyticus]|uniref:Transcriptional regulator, TetR family n=1 Tax=Jatrophihabitans endophyticus TaxID=1206085 RepID=A0A1M5IH90_9ACTN|nr:TetR/AcrR family transcriptional regulator [Jatrophihabitans endophyticus]SHG27621.1 transcriptional regulator, TetR family [Jatrophihabitans endophyticus]